MNIKMWLYKLAVKDKSVRELIDKEKREHAIAYSNWCDHCVGYGFPRKDGGHYMNCWELYDYFNVPEIRTKYIVHANLTPYTTKK